MRPEDVPAEWVEVADEAAWNAGNPLATPDVMPVWMREIGNRWMRAALAAVAPMIAQAERGRCLAVARRWTRDGQSATAHGIILGIEELDAIRARSTEEGP